MKPGRDLGILAVFSCAVCLLFHFVPMSVGHTIAVVRWRPLGLWQIQSPGGLALYYALILAALFALYLIGRRLLPTGEPGRARIAVYTGAAAMMAVLTLTPSLLSKDVFDYMVQGRILAIYRANPFMTPASAFPRDPFIDAMGWPDFTTLYGPGWVGACGLLAFVAPGTPAGTAILYKLAFAAIHLLNGVIVGALLAPRGRRVSLAGEYLYLWNPLVLLQTAGQAHNDVFLMLWVLLGLLFLSKREAFAGAYERTIGVVCLTVSILVKYVTAPLLALSLVVRAREGAGRGGATMAALLATVALGVLVLGYLPYAAGIDPLHFLRPYEMGNYQGGALMVADMAAGKILGGETSHEERAAAAPFMRLLSACLTLGLAAWGGALLFRVRSQEEIPRMALTILMAYLLAVTPLLRVSYGVWIVALAALIRDGLLRRAAILLSASLFALEIHWVYALRSLGSGVSVHREQAAAALVAVGAPFLYLLAGLVRRRRRGALA